MTDATTSTPAPVSATIPSPTIWLPYSVTAITTSPPKPPEPEVTAGPWDIADWTTKNFGPPWDPRQEMGVAALVVHRDTGEQRRNAARIVLNERSEDEAHVAASIAKAKDCLRAWVYDLNAAEWEDQSS